MAMNRLWSDLKFAARMLRKSPGFTAIAAGTLALGIAANTVIFTAVESFLLRPLPLRNPEQLVFVEQATKAGANMQASYPDFLDWKASVPEFDSLTAVQIDTFNMTGRGEPRRVRGSRVTGEFFRVMGLPAVLGRSFTPDEDRPGGSPAVILSHRFWSHEFGGSADVAGKTLAIDGRLHTIVGVMPPALTFPGDFCDFWVPLAGSAEKQDRGEHFLYVVGRLRDNVRIAPVRARLDAVARRLADAYPATNKDLGIRVTPFHERLTRGPRPALLLMFATVVFVLLICCANIANLLLARAVHRRQEVAIRLAVGAGRRQLLRQLLIESVLLAGLGGAFGLLLAVWGVDALTAAIGPGLLPMGGFAIDVRVLEFSLGLSLATGILFGMAPSLSLLRADVAGTLREAGRSGAAASARSRTAGALVIAEIGLAAILLIGSGLLIDTLRRMQSSNLGFVPGPVLTAEIGGTAKERREGPGHLLAVEGLLARLNATPGVQAASAVNWPPMTNDTARAFRLEGRNASNGERLPAAGYRVATPRYAEAMTIPVLRGRFVADTDRLNSDPVVVVNERFVQLYWPGQDPLGKRISLAGKNGSFEPWATVVGVVGNVAHTGPGAQPGPEFFFPLAQRSDTSLHLAIRTANPGALALALPAIVKAADPDMVPNLVRPMDRVIADRMASARITFSLFGLFSAVAVLLAAMGLYGVMSYIVARRTHEFGVRLALGASRGDLLRLVLRRSLGLTAAGTLLGVIGGAGVARLLGSIFEGVQANPVVFLFVAATLGVIALAASWFPLARTLAAGPLHALRES